jgi:hypothetical protein
MAVLLSLVAFFVFMGLAVFLWFWWAVPRSQVPPHFTEQELRRLEVQDRLRQTSYQLLTAAGLAGTFLATLVQFGLATRQWSADFELKNTQEQLTQYAEAIKTINGKDASNSAQIAGLTSLQLLGARGPGQFHRLASEVLIAFIAENHAKNVMEPSIECEDVTGRFPDSSTPTPKPLPAIPAPKPLPERGEAPQALKVAVQGISDPEFAGHRLNYADDKCDPARESVERSVLVLEHMNLGNLNLSGRDFSCAKMSNSKFHRSAFFGADLRGADMRGVHLEDFATPGFPAATIGNKLYLKEADGGPAEWQRYRCWTTDFRSAKLNNADFEGAILSGADLRGADVSGANFCRADLSRVNFTGAKGLTKEKLSDACVGNSYDAAGSDPGPSLEAQPTGLDVLGKDFRVPRCRSNKVCSYDKGKR